MQGGLNSGTMQGSAYSAATSVDPASPPTGGQPVAQREALRIGSISLTMEELLAIAVILNALVGVGTLYMQVSN